MRSNFVVKFDFPRALNQVPIIGSNEIHLTVFAKKKKTSDASEVMKSMCVIADRHEVDICLEVVPMNIFAFKDYLNITFEGQCKLEKYYTKYGFETVEKSTRLTVFKTPVIDIFMIRKAKYNE